MKRSIAFAVGKIRAMARPQAYYAAFLWALLAVSPALAGSGMVSGSPTATQAEAEAGTNNIKKLTPLRAAQQTTARIASQAEAEAGADNTKLMTPLRAAQRAAAAVASQAEAEAGTDNTKMMTPLRVQNAFDKPAIYPAGAIIGSNFCSSSARLDTAGTAIPEDNTVPQNNEGDEVITCSYTAAISGSKLNFFFNATWQGSADAHACALFVDTTANALKTWGFTNATSGNGAGMSAFTSITVSDTSAHTYKVRCGKLGSGAAMTFNGNGGASLFGLTAETALMVQEVRQ